MMQMIALETIIFIINEIFERFYEWTVEGALDALTDESARLDGQDRTGPIRKSITNEMEPLIVDSLYFFQL